MLAQDMSKIEKRDHIILLCARKPMTRNTLRILHTYPYVQDLVQTVIDASPAQMAQQYSGAASRNEITENWKMPLALFLTETMKPANFARDPDWEPKMSAVLSILSGMTLGQAHIVRDLLVEAIERRIRDTQDKREVVQTRDVLDTVHHIYEAAGLLKQKVNEHAAYFGFFILIYCD